MVELLVLGCWLGWWWTANVFFFLLILCDDVMTFYDVCLWILTAVVSLLIFVCVWHNFMKLNDLSVSKLSWLLRILGP